MKLPERFKKLKVGTKLKINNKVYIIKKRSFHKSEDKYHNAEIIYDLGNNFFLSFQGDWSFFQMITKKSLFNLFISKNANYLNIKDIKLLNSIL